MWNDSVETLYETHLRLCAWPNKVDPVLDYLLLDSLVLSFGTTNYVSKWNTITEPALRCFKPGFALGMPKNVVIEEINYEVSADFLYDEDGIYSEQCVKRLMKDWTEYRLQCQSGGEIRSIEVVSGCYYIIGTSCCEEQPDED